MIKHMLKMLDGSLYEYDEFNKAYNYIANTMNKKENNTMGMTNIYRRVKISDVAFALFDECTGKWILDSDEIKVILESCNRELEELLHAFNTTKEDISEVEADIDSVVMLGSIPESMSWKYVTTDGMRHAFEHLQDKMDSIVADINDLMDILDINGDKRDLYYSRARVKFLEYKSDCLMKDKKKYKDISNKQAKEIRDLNDKIDNMEIKCIRMNIHL